MLESSCKEREIGGTMFCPNCGVKIPDGARFCPECGGSVSPAANPVSSGPVMPEGTSQAPVYQVQANLTVQNGKVVNKVAYVLLALFLGGLGIHKFYAGKTGMGILYLVFCWTFIPAIVALVEAIIAITKPADANGNIVI